MPTRPVLPPVSRPNPSTWQDELARLLLDLSKLVGVATKRLEDVITQEQEKENK